jgi:hypothetical protein
MIFRVEITRLALKQLRKVPQHIVDNVMIWVAAVEHDGLEEVRKVPGHGEVRVGRGSQQTRLLIEVPCAKSERRRAKR